jgi:small subunit ribosomal protein S13e
MGRMHAPGKGISQSALPYRRSVPQWMKMTSDEVKDQIFKLAKKGLTPSQIGVILRDSHGVAQVQFSSINVNFLQIPTGSVLYPSNVRRFWRLKSGSVRIFFCLQSRSWSCCSKSLLIILTENLNLKFTVPFIVRSQIKAGYDIFCKGSGFNLIITHLEYYLPVYCIICIIFISKALCVRNYKFELHIRIAYSQPLTEI